MYPTSIRHKRIFLVTATGFVIVLLLLFLISIVKIKISNSIEKKENKNYLWSELNYKIRSIYWQTYLVTALQFYLHLLQAKLKSHDHTPSIFTMEKFSFLGVSLIFSGTSMFYRMQVISFWVERYWGSFPYKYWRSIKNK